MSGNPVSLFHLTTEELGLQMLASASSFTWFLILAWQVPYTAEPSLLHGDHLTRPLVANADNSP